jgi:hypothetical protein
MKRTRMVLVPPFVFALTVVLTWFAGAPAGHPLDPEGTIPRGPRTRVAAAVDSGGLADALLQLERNILPHNPAPPCGEIHDAEGMEKALLENHGEAWARRDLTAALDWALARLKGLRRVECLEKFFQVAVSQDREAALRVWQAMPEGCLKERAAEAIRRCSR